VWEGLTDLAMLGTIADIVPLRGENRALVAHGISATRQGPRTPLAALCAVSGVSVEMLTADNVAFALAPRLNAAGRMADPRIALDLLLTDDPQEAEAHSQALDEHNKLRQTTEADLSEAATALAERSYHGQRALVLAGEGWHEGVKGIVASRIARTYGVPVFLFAIENGVAKGSARSVGTVDLFKATEESSGTVERFGGHAAAVGLTLPAADLGRFESDLLAHLDELPEVAFESGLRIDAEVTLDELSVELGTELSLLAPFGHSNPRPLLALRSVFMNGRDRVGRGGVHLKFTAYDGAFSVPAISFRCADIERLSARDGAVDLAFELDVDEWRGRKRAQLIVRDIVIHDLERPGGDTAELLEDLFARADELLAREEYAGIEDAPSFHTKLAGVTFEGRQDVLARLEVGLPLRIEREPENPYDPQACAVFDPHGRQVGYLNRRLASVLAPAIDAGVEYDIEISDITGGEPGQSRGVNVLVSRRDAAGARAEGPEDMAARRTALTLLEPEELDAELVASFIGDRSLHDAQSEALAALAQRENTLVVMATGRGKSLIFHLHAARIALRDSAASVFVFPLRALVADQAFHLQESFSKVGVTVRTVTGETSQTERDEAFAELAQGALDVVLTTPEFLHFHVRRFVDTGRVGFVVIDEAHHVGLSRAGNRPAYARIGEAVTALGNPTVLAVTATASDEIADQIRATLGISKMVLDPTVRDNLLIEDRRAGTDRDGYLVALAARHEKMVVYVNSRDASVRLARMLRKKVPELAWKTAFYNGGLSRSVRQAVEAAFRSGEVQVVIATSAFGEGVNIPDIRHVSLYHLPFNAVEFNQMAGRAGRDGAVARIHLLFGEKDARINENILSTLAPTRDDLAVLYRVLREISEREGEGFEITNAELAEKCSALSRSTRLDDRGVSSALGIFRDLGLVVGEGHGAYRRLTFVPSSDKLELTDSVRYAEGLDEIEEFGFFREWVLSATAEELLVRFNRPILPTHS
jgi:single-stranded-DNA-specific exonuclease